MERAERIAELFLYARQLERELIRTRKELDELELAELQARRDSEPLRDGSLGEAQDASSASGSDG